MAHHHIAAMSGGGSNGLFQAGVMSALLADGKVFSGLCGVSTGSLNACKIGMAGVNSLAQLQMVSQIHKLYKDPNIERRILGPNNAFTKIVNTLSNGGMYDNKYLRRTIIEEINFARLRDTPVYVTVGATSLTYGDYHSWLNKRIGPDQVLASSVMPALMQPVFWNGEWWTDGGVASLLPLSDAFMVARNIKHYEPDATFTVHAILAAPRKLSKVDRNSWSVDKTLARFLNVTMKNALEGDLAVAVLRNHLADGKNTIAANLLLYEPDHDLGDALDFNKNWDAMFAHGQERGDRAQTLASTGEAVTARP